MKKYKVLGILGLFATLLCGCSTKLEKVDSGIFVVDEIIYIAKEGKTISDESKDDYKDYMDKHASNILILNSDNSARIYGYYINANNNSQTSGPITWELVEGTDEFEGYHYIYCSYQGGRFKELTQNPDGEIYSDFYLSSKEIDHAHVTYKLVKEYKNLKAH